MFNDFGPGKRSSKIFPDNLQEDYSYVYQHQKQVQVQPDVIQENKDYDQIDAPSYATVLPLATQKLKKDKQFEVSTTYICSLKLKLQK